MVSEWRPGETAPEDGRMTTPNREAIEDVQTRVRAQGLCGESFVDAWGEESLCILPTPCERHGEWHELHQAWRDFEAQMVSEFGEEDLKPEVDDLSYTFHQLRRAFRDFADAEPVEGEAYGEVVYDDEGEIPLVELGGNYCPWPEGTQVVVRARGNPHATNPTP